MIKTPLSTMIGGAGIWTPGATTIGAFGAKKTLNQLIKSLFANNEQGFAYDPNDLTTMFQDAAGTVPVTAVGQPVGLIRDKSGRNNHAYQTNSASRPILRKNAVTGANYLEFDGSDDFLQTSNIDFTSTDKVSLFVGVRKLSDAAVGVLIELGFTQLNAFNILAPRILNAASYGFSSRGSLIVDANTQWNYLAPTSSVITAKGSISGNSATLRINGLVDGYSSANQGTGNYGNLPLYIGRRVGQALPFNGHLYSLIGIGRLTTDAETIALEKLIAKNTGVTLSV